MEFYTNCVPWGNSILVRGIRDGTRFAKKEKFKPTLFVDSKIETGWKSIYGKNVQELPFDSIKEAKAFVDRYRGVENVSIYGQTDYQHQYIAEAYKGRIEFEAEYVRIYSLDIEVASENGFPKPEVAEEEVLLITVQNKKTKKITQFGSTSIDPTKFTGVIHKNNYEYIKCKNETDLLKTFLLFWKNVSPDVVTGWYVNSFDIPYLVNRAAKILSEGEHLAFSPWKIVREKLITNNYYKTTAQTYILYGISILDYYELYRKFTFETRESYKLDHIATVELKKGKVENPFDTYKEFYSQNFQLFAEYNVIDVELVDMLDEKLNLIELIMTVAYEAKCNYNDVFSPVCMWDCILYNAMLAEHIVAPQAKDNPITTYEGAWVKVPVPGKYKYIASIDATSLYPRLILECNISPETMVESERRTDITEEGLLDREYDLSFLKEKNLAMTVNGVCYSKQQQGFIPKVVERIFNERSEYKKKKLEYEKMFQKTGDEKYLRSSVKFGIKELNYKIMLNSCYGALGNKYFRFFDIRMAEGITLSGRFFIKSVGLNLNKYLNQLGKTEGKEFWLYTDTDSVYITLEPLLKNIKKSPLEMISIMESVYNDKIKSQVEQICGGTSDYINGTRATYFKREAFADVGIWTGKKRYILRIYDNEGVRYNSPKIKVVGLQSNSAATPAIMREKLKESYAMCLDDSEEAIQKYIKDLKREFSTYKPEQIAFPMGVDGLTKYESEQTIYTKGTPMHVRASLLYNHLVKKMQLTKKYELIRNGDKIKFIYLQIPNHIKENIIGFISKIPKEFGVDKIIDYESTWKRAYLNPIRTVLDAIGWSAEPRATLDDLFD